MASNSSSARASGLTLVPQDGENADELLRNADMALYRAKADGRRLHRFFEREMENRVQRRREMEVDLRQRPGEWRSGTALPAVDQCLDRLMVTGL